MRTLRAQVVRLAFAKPELRPHLLPLLREKTAGEEMPEAQFWDLIKQIGWGTKTKDYKRIKQSLMAILTPEQAKGMYRTFRKLQGPLSRAIEAWEDEDDDGEGRRNIPLGDDGMSDLLAHILGLGKTVYAKVLKKPALAMDLAKQVPESFAYAIPSNLDFRDEDKFVDWAKKTSKSLENLAKYPRYKSLVPKAKKLIDILDLLVKGEIAKFLEEEGPGKTLAVELENDVYQIERDAMYGNLGPGQPSIGMLETEEEHDNARVFDNKWAVWNLFSDVREKLERKNFLNLTLK